MICKLHSKEYGSIHHRASFYKVGSKVYPSELCVRVIKRRSTYWRDSQEKRTCQVQVFEVVSPMWGRDLQ